MAHLGSYIVLALIYEKMSSLQLSYSLLEIKQVQAHNEIKFNRSQIVF